MKYCKRCGTQLDDDAAYCWVCGTAVGTSGQPSAAQPSVNVQPVQAPVNVQPAQTPVNVQVVQPAQTSAIKIVAKVFMLISCILSGFWIIPLAWGIPMTVIYWNRLKNHQPVGVGFKVCTLIFVSLVAGILMLCDETPD